MSKRKLPKLYVEDLPASLRNNIDANPQPGRRVHGQAAIFLSRTGEVSFAEVESEPSGQMPSPPHIYFKALLCWFIGQPGDGRATCMNTLARDLRPDGQIYQLLQRVHRGHMVTRENNGDLKGELSSDAVAASDELTELLADYPIDYSAPTQTTAEEFLNDIDLADIGIDIDRLNYVPDRATLEKAVEKMCAIAVASKVELVMETAVLHLREHIEMQLEFAGHDC